MRRGASPRPRAAAPAAGASPCLLLAALLSTATVLAGPARAQVRGSGGVPAAVPVGGAFTPTLSGVSSAGASAVQVLPAVTTRVGFRISNNAPVGGATLWCSDVLGTAAWAAGASGTFPILAGTFYEGGADASALVCGTASGTVAITVEGW